MGNAGASLQTSAPTDARRPRSPTSIRARHAADAHGFVVILDDDDPVGISVRRNAHHDMIRGERFRFSRCRRPIVSPNTSRISSAVLAHTPFVAKMSRAPDTCAANVARPVFEDRSAAPPTRWQCRRAAAERSGKTHPRHPNCRGDSGGRRRPAPPPTQSPIPYRAMTAGPARSMAGQITARAQLLPREQRAPNRIAPSRGEFADGPVAREVEPGSTTLCTDHTEPGRRV